MGEGRNLVRGGGRETRTSTRNRDIICLEALLISCPWELLFSLDFEYFMCSIYSIANDTIASP